MAEPADGCTWCPAGLAVSDQVHAFSDHHALTWRINFASEESDLDSGAKYNLKHADKESFQRDFRTRLDGHADVFAELRDAPQAVRNTGLLGRTCEAMHDALGGAAEATVPKRRPSKHLQPWWTPELTASLQRMREAEQAAQNFPRTFKRSNQLLTSTAARERNYHHRFRKRTKAEYYNKLTEEATVEDIWDMRKWSQGRRGYRSPDIRRPDGSFARTHAEKCSALRDTLYQRLPHIEGLDEPDLTTPHSDDIPFRSVTREEVRRGIFDPDPKKAPGDEGVPYTGLRWAWEVGEEEIYLLVSLCALWGYHPRRWRRAIPFVLKKAEKTDWSNPRSYRLITLLVCLGTVLERIMAKRLTYLASAMGLVHPNQFGAMPASSTVDAALCYTHDVQTARDKGLVTSSLTFDIKGYFDFVNHKRLLNVLREKRVPLPIVQWVASFLQDRQASVCLDGRISDIAPVENGVPQGSPVSGILSAFYSTGLIEFMQQRRACAVQMRQLNPTFISPSLSLYVDDGRATVHSDSLELNTAELRYAFCVIREWFKGAGLQPDLDELMHHTWRTRDGSFASLAADDDLSMPYVDADGQMARLRPLPVVRWLGIFFDPKLTYRAHVDKACAKARKAAMGLRMLANTVRGLSQDHMCRLYISCILPILTYASAVWWMQQQWQVQQLQRVQNLCLRMICAVFRTSPIYALQIEAGIPPIQYTLDKCDDLAAALLHKLGPHSPVLQRLSKAWHGRVRFEEPPVQHRKRRTYSTLQYLSKLTSPLNERIDPFQIAPWALALQKRFPGRVHLRPAPKGAKKPDAAEAHTREVQMLGWDPKQLIVYTDGSLLQTPRGRSTGAAFVVYQEEEELAHGCIPMGARAEVYDAEMCALASAMDHVAHYMDFDLGSISHLHFYADNTSSVSTILDSRPRPSQRFSISFCEHAAEWLAADGSHQLSVSWVPSHVGVLGNERADELAKAAAPMEGPTSATYSYLRRRAKERVLEKWRADHLAAFMPEQHMVRQLCPHHHTFYH